MCDICRMNHPFLSHFTREPQVSPRLKTCHGHCGATTATEASSRIAHASRWVLRDRVTMAVVQPIGQAQPARQGHMTTHVSTPTEGSPPKGSSLAAHGDTVMALAWSTMGAREGKRGFVSSPFPRNPRSVRPDGPSLHPRQYQSRQHPVGERVCASEEYVRVP